MRLRALDTALKDAFFNGCNSFMKLEWSDGLNEKLPPHIGVLGKSESKDDIILPPMDLDVINVERDIEPEELNYIIYLKTKYKDLESVIKQEVVKIRVEQAKRFLEEREKVIEAQGLIDWGLYYLEEYLEKTKDTDIQDFLKACVIIPQGQWLNEEDSFLLYGEVQKEDRKIIQEQFPVLLSYYESILKEVLFDEEKKTVPEKPEYIRELVKQYRLYPDGKRVMKSLEDVLDYLYTVMDPIPAKFIQENFLRPNGKAYSLKHIQDIMSGRK